MRVEVLVEEADYLKLRIEDEAYTLYNLLRYVLDKRSEVKMVGILKTETFQDKFEFQMQVSEDSEHTPVEHIGLAIEEIEQMTESFAKEIEQIMD